MVISRFELETFDRFLPDLLQKFCIWRPCYLCSVTFGIHNMRRSVPEGPNPHFCNNGALCAKRFTSYSDTTIIRNREMWDRRLWHWAPHILCTNYFLYGAHVQEAGWALGLVCMCAKNLAPTWFRSPDSPARSQSLYRLSYPGPLNASMRNNNNNNNNGNTAYVERKN
jgi:hypothetical protein